MANQKNENKILNQVFSVIWLSVFGIWHLVACICCHVGWSMNVLVSLLDQNEMGHVALAQEIPGDHWHPTSSSFNRSGISWNAKLDVQVPTSQEIE